MTSNKLKFFKNHKEYSTEILYSDSLHIGALHLKMPAFYSNHGLDTRLEGSAQPPDEVRLHGSPLPVHRCLQVIHILVGRATGLPYRCAPDCMHSREASSQAMREVTGSMARSPPNSPCTSLGSSLLCAPALHPAATCSLLWGSSPQSMA